MGFWWHFKGDDGVQPYLQLEQEKFCFKIWVKVKDHAKRAEIRNRWHNVLMAESKKHGISLGRPPRFGNGAYMTVAVLDGEYRLTDAKGLVDVEATCDLLRKAGKFLDACCA